MSYKTLMREGSFEQVVEKSRFIGQAKPIHTRQEGESYLQEIRKEHREATHNVPVIILGDQMQLQWSSEDGEPQGTAGAPMLKLLVMEGLTNLVLVVTRYFGGTKLGTGGLVRAYSKTAKGVIRAAGIGLVVEKEIMTIGIDYSQLDKLNNAALQIRKEDGNALFELGPPQYMERVSLTLRYLPEKQEEIQRVLGDVTSGSYQVFSRERALIKEPLDEG
jgi:uncharacterized YigZ family protein